MKKQLLILILGLFAAATSASAGQVCGTLSKSDVCGEQGCTKLFLHDEDRGEGSNPYLVEPTNNHVEAVLNHLTNGTSEVCVQGLVGANNDPDLLLATGASAKIASAPIFSGPKSCTVCRVPWAGPECCGYPGKH